jgi:hypothetical protein
LSHRGQSQRRRAFRGAPVIGKFQHEFGNRSLGWVFSRSPTIDEVDYQVLLDRFAALGYDKTRFRKIIQLPAQIGMPGFWNDAISPTPGE